MFWVTEMPEVLQTSSDQKNDPLLMRAGDHLSSLKTLFVRQGNTNATHQLGSDVVQHGRQRPQEGKEHHINHRDDGGVERYLPQR